MGNVSPIRLRVKELRKLQGLTQEQLGKQAGVRRATVVRLEGDRVREIDLDILDRIARALGVDAAYLIVHDRSTDPRSSD